MLLISGITTIPRPIYMAVNMSHMNSKGNLIELFAFSYHILEQAIDSFFGVF